MVNSFWKSFHNKEKEVKHKGDNRLMKAKKLQIAPSLTHFYRKGKIKEDTHYINN